MTVRELVQRLMTLDPNAKIHISAEDDLMGRHYYDPVAGVTEIDAVYYKTPKGSKVYVSQWSNVKEEGRERILLLE